MNGFAVAVAGVALNLLHELPVVLPPAEAGLPVTVCSGSLGVPVTECSGVPGVPVKECSGDA